MNSNATAVVVLVVTSGLAAAWYFLAPSSDAANAQPVSGGGGATDESNAVDPQQVVSTETDMADPNAVRPIRDNNWGDLEFSPANQWKGQVGSEGVYCVFDKPENGLRAAFITLHSYMNRGLNTVRKIITEWAPPPGNPTAAYINTVTQWLGVSADQVLSWRDAYTLPLMMYICQFECGSQPGTQDQYQIGLDSTGL